jgi:hypothetical protein
VVWNVASRSRAFGSQYLFGPEARLINKRPFQKNCAVRATAASALAGFSAKRNSIAAPLRKSFTYARGKEMLRHQGTHRRYRREGLLLRPSQALAAWHL